MEGGEDGKVQMAFVILTNGRLACAARRVIPKDAVVVPGFVSKLMNEALMVPGLQPKVEGATWNGLHRGEGLVFNFETRAFQVADYESTRRRS